MDFSNPKLVGDHIGHQFCIASEKDCEHRCPVSAIPARKSRSSVSWELDHDFVDKFLPSGRSHVMALDGAQRRVQLVDDRHAGWDLKVRNRVIGDPIEIFQERPERVAMTRNENAPT